MQACSVGFEGVLIIVVWIVQLTVEIILLQKEVFFLRCSYIINMHAVAATLGDSGPCRAHHKRTYTYT